MPYFAILEDEESGSLMKTIAFPDSFLEALFDRKKDSIELLVIPTDAGKQRYKFWFFSALGHCDSSEGFPISVDAHDAPLRR